MRPENHPNFSRLRVAALVVLVAPSWAAAGERVRAAVDCAETRHPLVYDCQFTLTGKKSGAPFEGATVVVGADMPSMPMAHNVKPVTARSAGKAGVYEARIALEMRGEWALKLDISGPTRDRVIHKMHFGEAGGGHGAPMTHGGSGQVQPTASTHGSHANNRDAAGDAEMKRGMH